MKRSRELILSAFFLSRYSEPSSKPGGMPLPPRELGVRMWRRAYAMFYRRLGGGRTLSVFTNSIKNARDNFDSHTNSGRIGWRAEPSDAGRDRPPRPLNDEERNVLEKWSERSREALWDQVRGYCDELVRTVSAGVLSDLAAELDPEQRSIRSRTEGGKRVAISVRIERDPSPRAAAIRVHGTTCMACGFSFEAAYGEWGEKFGIVHHLQPLGGETEGTRETDPATDLAVLCANCHCMVHRRKGIVLTIEELRAKLQCAFGTAFLPLHRPDSGTG